jgi:hypothetical protein
VASIVKSIYYHRLDTFGTNFNALSLVLQAELNALNINSAREFPKKSKKGTTVGSIQATPQTAAGDHSGGVVKTESSFDETTTKENLKSMTLIQGGAVRPGDLPPVAEQVVSSKPQDRPEFSLLLAYAPAAARNIAEGKSSPAFEASSLAGSTKNELQILPSEPEINLAKPKVFKTLKALRSANYMERDPIDRLDKALGRCLKRKSEPEILAAMVKDEPQIRLARRRGTIYEPAEGPYRRVLKAFSILPEHIRLELLFGPRGVL